MLHNLHNVVNSSLLWYRALYEAYIMRTTFTSQELFGNFIGQRNE